MTSQCAYFEIFCIYFYLGNLKAGTLEALFKAGSGEYISYALSPNQLDGLRSKQCPSTAWREIKLFEPVI